MSGHPRFLELLQMMNDIHQRKNSNYAREGEPLSNLKALEKYGIPAKMGLWVRMSDKWDRICNLISGNAKDAVNEPLCETLLDLANYTLLTIIVLEEELSTKTQTRTPEFPDTVFFKEGICGQQ